MNGKIQKKENENITHVSVGDTAFLLCEYDLIPVEILSVGKKTVRVDVPAWKGRIRHKKYVKPEKLIQIDKPFCIVWNTTKSLRGSYRIETSMYPERHKVGWRPTSEYVQEHYL